MVNSSVMVAPADSCFTSYTVCDHRSYVFRITKQCIVLLEMPPPPVERNQLYSCDMEAHAGWIAAKPLGKPKKGHGIARFFPG